MACRAPAHPSEEDTTHCVLLAGHRGAHEDGAGYGWRNDRQANGEHLAAEDALELERVRRAYRVRWSWPPVLEPDEVLRAYNDTTGEIIRGPARQILRRVLVWLASNQVARMERAGEDGF